MNKLIIEGAPPYDGEYEFEDFTSFKNRELRRIKKLSGIRVGEFQEALSAGDNDLIVGLAAVILERAGKEVDDDVLWEADGGFARFEFDTSEDPTQASPTQLESASSSETVGMPSSSGNGSSESSDYPEKSPSPTGALISETPISALDFGRNPSAS